MSREVSPPRMLLSTSCTREPTCAAEHGPPAWGVSPRFRSVQRKISEAVETLDLHVDPGGVCRKSPGDRSAPGSRAMLGRRAHAESQGTRSRACPISCFGQRAENSEPLLSCGAQRLRPGGESWAGAGLRPLRAVQVGVGPPTLIVSSSGGQQLWRLTRVTLIWAEGHITISPMLTWGGWVTANRIVRAMSAGVRGWKPR